MPEHFHLMISEPEEADPSVVMKVIKQRFARRIRQTRRKARNGQASFWPESHEFTIWQKRFYDFNVWSERKRIEKLRYIHRNPVKRGLVSEPEQWAWSSFRSYAYGERGKVRINFQEWPLAIKQRKAEDAQAMGSPLIRKKRE